MKKIVLTGGGTAGHVTPNIALMPALKERGYEIVYVGSHNGIEKELIEKEGIPYRSISSGKLRRYLSKENISDAFKVLKGIGDAKKVLKEEKPDIVFSKGGFVTVPVVLAAAKLGIPVVIHEADYTPGLANKIALPKAKAVCCNFPETLGQLPKGISVCTGSPIRAELLKGDRQAGKKLCGFTDDKPVILVIGGSLGAGAVNDAVRAALPELLKDFNICHACGKGKADESIKYPGYVQFEYLSDELADVLAMADVVISRAGANAIFEFLALKKPALLIPLPGAQSRGDQILNAASFRAQGFSDVLSEEDITTEELTLRVKHLYENRQQYITNMQNFAGSDAVEVIVKMIEENVKKPVDNA